MVGLGRVIQTVQLRNCETVAQCNSATVHNIQTEHQSTVCIACIMTRTRCMHTHITARWRGRILRKDQPRRANQVSGQTSWDGGLCSSRVCRTRQEVSSQRTHHSSYPQERVIHFWVYISSKKQYYYTETQGNNTIGYKHKNGYIIDRFTPTMR